MTERKIHQRIEQISRKHQTRHGNMSCLRPSGGGRRHKKWKPLRATLNAAPAAAAIGRRRAYSFHFSVKFNNLTHSGVHSSTSSWRVYSSERGATPDDKVRDGADAVARRVPCRVYTGAPITRHQNARVGGFGVSRRVRWFQDAQATVIKRCNKIGLKEPHERHVDVITIVHCLRSLPPISLHELFNSR